MILSDDMYVPALRWRMGEYQALMRLHDSVKNRVVPLICIPEVEFDFEAQEEKKTVHKHVLPFPGRFRSKWGARPAWITLQEKIAVGRMDGGVHVFDYVFESLRPYNLQGIPAIPLSADVDTLAATARAVRQDQHGLAVILCIEDLMTKSPKGRVIGVADKLESTLKETDLIIDLCAPKFEPYGDFANALIANLQKMGDLGVFRNLVLISTAVPKTFANVAKGTDQIPRHDWLFYKALHAALPSDMRTPIYGDYTIVHPDFVARDMRIIKPDGKVIYTTPTTWGTRKGDAFRGNETQMHGHCTEIVNNPDFRFKNRAYSFGDDFIAKCATKQEGPSNQTRWKTVAINHHITHVTDDLAKLVSASSRP